MTVNSRQRGRLFYFPDKLFTTISGLGGTNVRKLQVKEEVVVLASEISPGNYIEKLESTSMKCHI